MDNYEILDNLTIIINKINLIEKQQIQIINELEYIKNKINANNQLNNIIPIKKIDKPLEYIDKGYIDNNFVIKVLTHRNINTIIKIIKKIYLPNDKFILPFKYGDNKKICLYFNDNNEWVTDNNDQLANILFTNISKLLSEININSIDSISIDEWDKNNDFINDLRTKSIYLNYFKKLKDELLS